MSEQVSEKKSSPDFLKSEKYAALQKEVADSVASVKLTEGEKEDQDMAPVFDYFEKELSKNGISEVQAEKLFWETVAEKIKTIRFKFIYRMIRFEIETKEYALARRIMMEELRNTLQRLSPTLYHNLSKRSMAMVYLKEKFYAMFPEIEALIEETEEEKRAKIKRPTGEYGPTAQKHVQEQFYQDEEDEKWEKEKGQYLVEKRNWEIPKNKDLKPGLKIIFLDRESNREYPMEFLEYPHFEDGDLFVKIKWNGEEDNIKLADFGLAPYVETGLWNSRYIPLNWEIKKENK